jgi:DNA-directed RNA polymerase subunit K/omega
MAIRRAKQIPSGKKTPAKCKAVHRWVIAIKEMLKG